MKVVNHNIVRKPTEYNAVLGVHLQFRPGMFRFLFYDDEINNQQQICTIIEMMPNTIKAMHDGLGKAIAKYESIYGEIKLTDIDEVKETKTDPDVPGYY